MDIHSEFKHPVDRGWAWLICLSTCVANFFVTGGIRIVGLLFIELIEYFQSDNAWASLVVALLSAGFAICTCVGNILGVRFGMRPVALCGAVVAFLGMAFTVIAPDIKVVLVTLGLMSGIGYGFMFGPSMVMIGQYFKTRTSVAGGLAVAGGSIGQLALPHFFNFMSDRYSFRGAMLMYAGLALHAIPAMMLLRPPSFYGSRVSRGKVDGESPVERSVDLVDLEVKPLGLTKVEQNGSSIRRHANGLHVRTAGKPSTTRYWLMDGSIIEKRASLLMLESEVASLSMFATSIQDISKEMEKLPAVEEDEEKEEPQEEPTPPTAFQVFYRKCCDSALLGNPTFLLFAVALSFGHGGYVTTCLYSPPYGYELWGSKTLIAIIISVIGIADLVGRILGGVVAGMNLVQKPYLVGGSFLISGVCTIFMPFAPVKPVFFIFSAVLGLLGGTYMAQLVVMIVELFGQSLLASGMGLAAMCMGLFVIPIPPMLGAAQKSAGSYSASLRLSGMILIFGGLFFCAIPLLEWYKKKRNRTKESTVEDLCKKAEFEEETAAEKEDLAIDKLIPTEPIHRPTDKSVLSNRNWLYNLGSQESDI